MTLARPDFTVCGDVYTFRWPGIELSLDRFVERRDELTAELTVYSHEPATKGLLYQARFNLMAGTTRKQVADMLAGRMEYDWYGVLQSISTLALNRWREGEPAVNLWDVQPQETRWLLHPYVEYGSPTVLFALGGSGKSVTALAMAYTVAAGLRYFVGKTDGTPRPVLYLDWETDPALHAERMRAIASKKPLEVQPQIFYKRMTTSLPEAAAAIRKDIVKTGAKLVVIDSIGYAGGGEPKEAGIAIALFGAIRTFGVATLCVHHRNKDTKDTGGDPKSLFGSAYYFNSARHVWQMRGTKDEEEDELGIGMIHIKSNNGRLQKRHGYNVRFTNNSNDITTAIAFEYEDNLANIDGQEKDAPLPDRIIAELSRDGVAKTVKEISEALEANQASVQTKVTGLRKRGQIVSVPGNRWGIPAAANE